MTFEKTYIIKDNKLTIKLPKEFRSKKKVRVIIEGIEDSREKKLEQLKKASKDQQFLSDIQEITDDFQYSDKDEI